MKPIYEPKGKAKEYGDYALNIYTGCPHRCYYSRSKVQKCRFTMLLEWFALRRV